MAPQDSSFGRTFVIGIAVCCLMAGVVLRATAAGDYLWLDEQHTAWVVNGGLADVAPRAADGNQTPLFFYASWAAVQVGGESALSVRLPALLCGLALMTIVSVGVYRRTGSAASLLVVSAFFLLDYDAIFYASEARPYAMVQLLGVVQALAFFGWISAVFSGGHQSASGKGLAIATAVLAAIIFYTHPTGMLLMVAELIFVAGLCLVKREYPLAKLLTTAAVCGALILPGVIMIGFVWQRRANWAAVSDANKVFDALATNTLVMIVLPLALLLLDRYAHKRNSADDAETAPTNRLLAFIACWAVLPPLAIYSLDVSGWLHLAIGRYAIVGAVAFPIFAAAAVATMRSDLLRWIVTASIVGWMAYASGVPHSLSIGGFRHENWQEVVRIINAEDESLPVFLVANLIEDKLAESDQSQRFQRYLGFPLRGIPRVVAPQRIVPRPSQGKILSAENLVLIAERGGGLIVVRDSEVYRDAIRLEILAVLQGNAQTKSAKLMGAPIQRPAPNNLHLFMIKVD
jgi:hypothetical protein